MPAVAQGGHRRRGVALRERQETEDVAAADAPCQVVELSRHRESRLRVLAGTLDAAEMRVDDGAHPSPAALCVPAFASECHLQCPVRVRVRPTPASGAQLDVDEQAQGLGFVLKVAAGDLPLEVRLEQTASLRELARDDELHGEKLRARSVAGREARAALQLDDASEVVALDAALRDPSHVGEVLERLDQACRVTSALGVPHAQLRVPHRRRGIAAQHCHANEAAVDLGQEGAVVARLCERTGRELGARCVVRIYASR